MCYDGENNQSPISVDIDDVPYNPLVRNKTYQNLNGFLNLKITFLFPPLS